MEASTAVVLACGRGLRLSPLTDSLPKALLRIRSRTLLEWVIEWLAGRAVRNVVVGVAHGKERIMDYFGDGSRFGIRVRHSVHTVEGGTAEGFRRAIEHHVDGQTFIAMNGDELTDLDLAKLHQLHLRSGAIATVAVTEFKSPFGIVRLDSDDRIVRFEEKARIPGAYASIGEYAFQREILDYVPERGDVETVTFPVLSEMRRLQAYRHNGFWMTVNNLKELQEAEGRVESIFARASDHE